VPAGTRFIVLNLQVNGPSKAKMALLADDLYFYINAARNTAPGPEPVEETGIRGAIYDLARPSVTCRNQNTRKSVKANLGVNEIWNCESLGLKAKRGQKIQITITGQMP